MQFKINIQQLQKKIESNQRYKASLLAAQIIESGASPEDIIITRRKTNIDGVLHEIENISVKYPYLYPDQPYIEIEGGKDGIYDSVAEGLFFSGKGTNKENDKKDLINRIKRDRESEQYIRRFMQLFEVESDRFLTEINIKELQYDYSLDYDSLCGFYAQYWEIIPLMQREEAMRFLKVIPYISSLRGNLHEAAEAMSYILGVKIDIRLQNEDKYIPNLNKASLKLGNNFVLKSKTGKRKVEIMLVTVSEIDTHKCREFVKNHSGDKILSFLCETLLDADIEFRIKIIPKAESRGFSFSNNNKKAFYLGINTYL